MKLLGLLGIDEKDEVLLRHRIQPNIASLLVQVG
jgi:hypothetical protein